MNQFSVRYRPWVAPTLNGVLSPPSGVHQHHTYFKTMIRTTDLVSLGATAAEAYDECDTAQTALNASFGVTFEAAKDNLLRDFQLAESEGLDLSCFQGSDSRFKYNQFNTNIVVRITRIPTPHSKLEKLAARVEKLEAELKVAKLQLKHTAEQLVASGDCDERTDKVSLAFTRLKR